MTFQVEVTGFRIRRTYADLAHSMGLDHRSYIAHHFPSDMDTFMGDADRDGRTDQERLDLRYAVGVDQAHFLGFVAGAFGSTHAPLQQANSYAGMWNGDTRGMG